MTGFYLIAVIGLATALIVALAANRNILRANKEMETDLRTLRARLSECLATTDIEAAVLTDYDAASMRGFVTVYRRAPGLPDGRLEICRYYCDPMDLDDLDYKRIHAEDVARAINERP